jgi:hypothetical protein
VGGAALDRQHGGDAFAQAGAEDGIGEVFSRRVEVLEAVEFGRRRAAERLELREDEPHPMRAFVAGAELGEGGGVDGVLGGEEVGEHIHWGQSEKLIEN